jgi:hypothetical protein
MKGEFHGNTSASMVACLIDSVALRVTIKIGIPYGLMSPL